MWKKLLVFLFLFSCSSESVKEIYKIGVDPSEDFEDISEQKIKASGFISDLLLEIAKEAKVTLEKVETSSDNLIFGLKNDSYNGIFSFKKPYTFNVNTYNFSKVFLHTGSVLVVREGPLNLKDMRDKIIAVANDEDFVLMSQKYPYAILKSYDSIAESLKAVFDGDIDGALITSFIAENYVKNIYKDKLKIGSFLMEDEGLRLVTLKRHKKLVGLFNKALDSLQKKGKLAELRQKWHLN